MKRNKILAAAIVAVLTAPLQAVADTANVSVYGKFDVSYDLVNTGTAANGTAGTTSGRVSSNTSRIGIKGAEDLGEGLSAIWQVESQLYPGDATVATLGVMTHRTVFPPVVSTCLPMVLPITAASSAAWQARARRRLSTDARIKWWLTSARRSVDSPVRMAM